MKIRIKGNSVRYRLTKTDVATMDSVGFVEEQTEFVNKTFSYRLEATDKDEISADFIENSIIIKMPKVLVKQWVETDVITFNDASGPVAVLLEKDFACLDPTHEDQSDNYPNPNLTC